MSAPTQDWVDEAVDLHGQGLSERQIAEAVGKAPSTVHSALAKRAEAQGDGDPEPAPPSSNGNGSHIVDAATAARLRASAESQGDSSGVIPGQTTVDDHIPPEDDPEHPDTLAAFREQAGEAVGPMPPQPPSREMNGGEQVHVEEIIVRGTTPLDFFNLGGKLPNKASLKFVGGKVGLEAGTAFKKGDRIPFTGYATVVAATPRDKRDRSTGIVVECELQLQAEIDDLRLA